MTLIIRLRVLGHGLLLIAALAPLWPALAMANPSGPAVVAGEAAVSGLGTARVTIQQATAQAIINWRSFNIAPNEVTRFLQPSVSAIALNRIFDANPSQILGSLQANGRIILLNPNGVFFGPNAQVSVGGLIASTLHITDQDFLRGHYLFQGGITDSWVKNAGRIDAGPQGVFLLAPNVENSGIIHSPEGHIALAAGTTVYLSNRADGRGFLVEVSAPAGQALNLKELVADGGQVSLIGKAVNQEGLVQANSVRERNGKVELYASEQLTLKTGSQTLAKGADQGVSDGGTVLAIADKQKGSADFQAGATIDVSGGKEGGHGGFIELSGLDVRLGGRFLGRAQTGFEGGRLLIDPEFLTVTRADLLNVAASGMAVSRFQADKDITINNLTFDFAQEATEGLYVPPAGGEGTLRLEAGRDVIIKNSTITNDIESWGFGDRWHYVTVAGQDIILNGSTLATGMAGRLDFTAGRDLTLSTNSALRTTDGGDIILNAGRDLLAANIWNPALRRGFGVRVEGTGNLTITAGRDFLGGTAGGATVGPGFLLTEGTASVTAGGKIGSPVGYATVTLGKGQVDLTAAGDVHLGVVQDKGLTEVRFRHEVTADPASTVTVTSTGGDVWLKPSLALQVGEDLYRQYYPASFEANAAQGSIHIDSNLTFWPSLTGRITFNARDTIRGSIPTILVPDPDYAAIFIPTEGIWRILHIPTALKDPKLAPFVFADPPSTAPPNPFSLDMLPKIETKGNPLVVRLIGADPNNLRGPVGDSLNFENRLNTFASNQPQHSAQPVSFTTLAGDIQGFFLDLVSPGIKKQVTVSSGRDIRDFNAQISVAEGVTAIVGAAGDVDMAKVGAAGLPSGVQFYGLGTGVVLAGGTLDLGNSTGITHAFSRSFSDRSDSQGRLVVAAGKDLQMTRSRIASLNGASLVIGVGRFEPVLARNGTKTVSNVLTVEIPNSQGVPAPTPVLLNGQPVVLDGSQLEITQGQVILFEGKPVMRDGLPVPNAQPLLVDGQPVRWDGKLVLVMDDRITLVAEGLVSQVSAEGGHVNVGTNVKVAGDSGSLPLGIVTLRGGDIDILATRDVNVNLSRIGTFSGGNIRATSVVGDINAGSGSKLELTTFVIEEPVVDAQGKPVFEADGITPKINRTLAQVPGSGIFTFHRDDPEFPLPLPTFDTPEITAVKAEIVKQGFLGRNTSTLEKKLNDLVEARKPEYDRIFDDFITNNRQKFEVLPLKNPARFQEFLQEDPSRTGIPLELGDIFLTAGRDVVVPPAGIRGRDIVLEAGRHIDLKGGQIEGRTTFNAGGQVVGSLSSFIGAFGGTSAAGATSGANSGGTSLGGGLGGVTGGVSASTATTASTASTMSNAVESAKEPATEKSPQQAEAKKAAAKAASTAGAETAKKEQGVRVRRGVTIQVDVKPAP
jgi:filamentous hemagglutinin family protein